MDLHNLDNLFSNGVLELRTLGERYAGGPYGLAQVVKLIQVAISHGAEIYNEGAHQHCYRLYDEVATLVWSGAAPETTAARARAELHDASTRATGADNDTDRAWIMRHAFDKILASYEILGQTIRVYLELGQRSFARNDYGGAATTYDHAVTLFDQIGATGPDDTEPTWRIAPCLLAHAHFALGDYGAATRSLRAGLKLLPEWLHMGVNLRDQYIDEDALDDHMAGLETFVDGHPGDTDAQLLHAYVHFVTGGRSTASRILCQLLQNSSDDDEAALMLSVLAEPA